MTNNELARALRLAMASVVECPEFELPPGTMLGHEVLLRPSTDPLKHDRDRLSDLSPEDGFRELAKRAEMSLQSSKQVEATLSNGTLRLSFSDRYLEDFASFALTFEEWQAFYAARSGGSFQLGPDRLLSVRSGHIVAECKASHSKLDMPFDQRFDYLNEKLVARFPSRPELSLAQRLQAQFAVAQGKPGGNYLLRCELRPDADSIPILAQALRSDNPRLLLEATRWLQEHLGIHGDLRQNW